MKKVIIITYYWPPMGGGGVQRWLKMTKYLRDFGWEPIIFTPKNGEISLLDKDSIKDIPKNIEELRTPIWEPFSIYKKITGKKKDEKMAPGADFGSNESSLIQQLSIFVRGNFFIPDARKFWIKPASKFLNNYLKENKIDAIISTGPPHSTHIIALNTIKKHKIAWLADFRDPWTDIDFYHKLKLTKWADKKHHRLEQEVLAKASQVVKISWSWGDYFNTACSKKPVVITNGYDPEDFENNTSIPLDKKFSLTHIGSLNEDRNPDSLWKALKELGNEIDGFLSDLEIQFIGQVDALAIASITKNGLFNNLIEKGSVPHKIAIKHMQSSQVLLLLLNDTPNVNLVVPGKLYEYIGAKRPVICIGSTVGDAAKVIAETKAGLISEFNDVTTLKQNILNYYQQYKERKLTISSNSYEKYSRKYLAGEIAKELNKLTK